MGCVHVPELITANKIIPQVYSGRFSVSYLKDNKIAQEQGRFEWKIATPNDAASAMQLALIGPLNNTLALIALKPSASIDKQASFTTPTNTLYAADLDTLMTNTLGWQLPLQTLLPWLKTTPPQEMPTGWTITVISRYPSKFPKIITANYAEQQIIVRLVFEEFEEDLTPI